MRVFDFDNTIYDGESALDFFMFCLKRKKSLLLYMPEVLSKAAKYKSGKIGMDEVYGFCNKMVKVFFKNSTDIEKTVSDFWEINISKLKHEILERISEDDVIISASPRFLLKGVQDAVKAKSIICTEIDEKTQELIFLCYGKNKVKAFEEYFKDICIDEFYTDSVHDMPMVKKAKKAYKVNGKQIEEFKNI